MSKLLQISCIILICLSPTLAEAACDQKRPVQQIDIRQIDGKIVVENKAQSSRCEVSNNQLDDEVQASRVVWMFHDLNCKPGECLVELAGKPRLSDKALKCDIGSPNKQKCRLKVNRLKRYCDRQHPGNTESCEFDYLIKVRGIEVDPSIIIKPRPTLAD